MAEKIKLIYIAGFGRNGGTLLDRILGQTQDFFSLGEFKFVWQKGILNNELCNCGKPFRECTFWSEVFQRGFAGFDADAAQKMVDIATRVDQTRFVPLLMLPKKPRAYQTLLEKYRDSLRNLYLTIPKASGARVLVDSSKFAGYALVLSTITEIEIYVVHLVRDSRANAYSWLRTKKKIEVQDEEAFVKRYSVISSSIQWIYRNLTSEWLKNHTKDYLRVRYEDLTENPKETYEKIMGMVNLPPDNSLFEDEKTVFLGDSHTQSGNPSRFQKGSIKIREDNAWKRDMKPMDKWIVTILTWPLLMKYGYLTNEQDRKS